MHESKNDVLLVSMPFAETSIPSIQLGLLDSYLKKREISVKSLHLYLNAADFYGLKNYSYLINPPNDPYAAQMVYSKYLFPSHWDENIRKFRYYFDEIIGFNKKIIKDFSFEKYVEQTDLFLNWAVEDVNWKNFDIIGFSLNYGQILPSLAIAKKIKTIYPEKKIVLGGSSTIKELGRRVLGLFPFVDYIISGDGEEPLFLLSSGAERKKIPGLIYRQNKKIVFNENDKIIDLNTLPLPDFSSYYYSLENVSQDIKQYFQLYGRFPIEFSRGCWWNKCTFCNIQAYHPNYREKTIDRFVKELSALSDIFNMLSFQVIACTLPQKDYKIFCNKIIDLGKDFDLYVESRAGQLKSDDYTLLKKAGFTTIQTGIESFSSSYLKKMNKGARLIDNIAALKYSRENNIKNSYNLIVDYPNEDEKDYFETLKNIKLFKQYLDPPQISTFLLGYKSPIFNNPDNFNIEEMDYKIVDTIMYPEEFLDKKFCFFTSFKRKKETVENPWKELVDDWKKDYNERKINSVKQDTSLNKYVFYFIDGKSFIKIYDRRQNDQVMIYVLDKKDRRVFLSCENVKKIDKIIEENPDLSETEVTNILNSFIESGIVFKENDFYLALPLSYNKVSSIYSDVETVQSLKKPEISTY